jgi:hypothetical protein
LFARPTASTVFAASTKSTVEILISRHSQRTDLAF